jgi:hypothetical protein
MAASGWKWKGRDGSRGGLLYEAGNWGDILKLLWLSATIRWKAGAGKIEYLDPFAGDVVYPLSRDTVLRVRVLELEGFETVRTFLAEKNEWPSAATMAGLLPVGKRSVFDADPEKRGRWRETPGVSVLEGISGWEILASRHPDPCELRLVDPYDFLAGWQDFLPIVSGPASGASTLLYVYNRSAGGSQAFAAFRAFRSALIAARSGLPGYCGRAAGDVFLPRAHHEIYFLPSRDDAGRRDFSVLAETLGRVSKGLAAAQAAAATFGSL